MEYFVIHVNLRLIYKNHQILLDFFYLIQIDEIQHQTKTKTANLMNNTKTNFHTLLFTSNKDNIINLNQTIK
jgi:hypothetical protein